MWFRRLFTFENSLKISVTLLVVIVGVFTQIQWADRHAEYADLYIRIGAVLFIAGIGIGLLYRKQIMKIKEYDIKLFLVFGIFMAVLLRVGLFGHESADYQLGFSLWFDFIKLHGGVFALKNNFANYPPLYLYFLTAATYLPLPKIWAIKLVIILFDIAAAGIVWLIVREKYRGGIVPALAALTLLFTPTVFVNSSFWGQCDIMYSAACLASLYFILKDKMFWAFSLFGLAFAFKLQAVFLLPLFIIMILKKPALAKYALLIPCVFVISLLPNWLLGRSLISLLTIYLHQTELFAELTLNAPNYMQWLPATFSDSWGKPSLIFAAMLITGLCFILYKSEKKLGGEEIIKIAMASSLLVPFVLPRMHDRYFFLADTISLLYAFYFPKYFYVPFLVIISSLFSYYPFLFNATVVDLKYLAGLILVALVLVTVDLVKTLFPIKH